MRKERALAGALAVTMVLGSLSLPESIGFCGISTTVQAAETVNSGTCGDDPTWVLDDEGTLTISGTGEMEDYYMVINLSPWYSNNEDIISIIIEDGVTSIGDSAFYLCISLAKVTFLGDAPEFGVEIFLGVTATAYYPANNSTWTEDVMQQYGGEIIWVAYETDDEEDEPSTEDGPIVEDEPDAEENDIFMGDINDDGSINYLDAMTALRYDAELIDLSDEQLMAGDVNGDGSVNSLDAILILRYDAGLIESFE